MSDGLVETIARAAYTGTHRHCFNGADPHPDDGAWEGFKGEAATIITALTEAGYAIVPVGAEGVPLRIPRSLYDALGNLVSHCADQRDIYPDAATALEVITDGVNLLYACIEDGVFGPLDSAMIEAGRVSHNGA